MAQKDEVLEYMRTNGSITSKDAYDDLGITQLGARLDDLEKDGHVIDRSEWKTVVNRRGEEVEVKNYKLIAPGQQGLFGTRSEAVPAGSRYGSPQ